MMENAHLAGDFPAMFDDTAGCFEITVLHRQSSSKSAICCRVTNLPIEDPRPSSGPDGTTDLEFLQENLVEIVLYR